jgi:regulatory protein
MEPRADAGTRQQPAPQQEPGSRAAALHRAGRLLSRRPRSAEELRARLRSDGFSASVVEEAMTRLVQLRLVDDAAFARAWVEERAAGGRSPALLVRELEARGVDRGVAEIAVAEEEVDELAQARNLAGRWLGRVAGLPPERQARRIAGVLGRRGFAADVVETALRSVLPPEGWD